MEDIITVITVIDGRAEIVDDVLQSDVILQQYLTDVFIEMLCDAQFLFSLPGHLNDGFSGANRVAIVLQRMRRIANINISR